MGKLIRSQILRLDKLLVDRGFFKTRERARLSILAGEVWSKTRRLEKSGVAFREDIDLSVIPRSPAFVSRAGDKLNHALETFTIDACNRICLDVGASTGGFTDCLLKAGAAFIFSVDVGYGQLDARLRNDARVGVLEKTNARYLTLEQLEKIDPRAKDISLVTMDVSFIGLVTLLRDLTQQLKTIKDWIFLFKPQFEVGKDQIRRGGTVKTPQALSLAIEHFETEMPRLGFIKRGGPEKSPLTGKKSGNVEYLYFYEFVKGSGR